MAIPSTTFIQLMENGIKNISDFDYFGDEESKKIYTNLISPPGIPDPADLAHIVCQNTFAF